MDFQAYAPDGSPRLFVGMFRPPLSEVDWAAYCDARHIYSYTADEPRNAWLRGAFDRALYADLGDKVAA